MEHFIQVMLVDDEYLALEDLKTLIDWEALGFHILSAARSGRQALRLFEEKPVDLIITDINMPSMDGITLIEQFRSKKQTSPLFLLLTAYAEVDYMKRAFRLGVEDYLIKDEITPAILREKLLTIREKYISSQALSYSFLQKSLSAYFNSSEASPPSVLTGFPSSNLLYCVLVPDIILPLVDDLFLYTRPSVTKLISLALSFAEKYRFPETENLCSLSAYNNKILVLLHIPELSSEASIVKTVHLFATELVTQLKKQMHISFSCFYSSTPMSLAALHKDYFSRQKSIRAHYFLGSCLTESLHSPKLYITNEKPDFTEHTLRELLKNMDNSLSQYIDTQFSLVIQKHNYMGLSLLINTCFSFLLGLSPDFSEQLSENGFTDIFALQQFIQKAVSQLHSQSSGSYSREIKKAIAYISENFSREDLSIQEIADEVGLSATHFSRIFKAETAKTVWDYLTDFRIEKACRILKNTNAKIYEVAEMTGYSSPQYFSQVFMKQTGLKPLDYRKKDIP